MKLPGRLLKGGSRNERCEKMKGYLIWLILISIALYFGSSLAFPILGESIVVPVMIICLAIGGISSVALIIILVRQKLNND